MTGEIIIEGLDLVDALTMISAKKDKFVAIMLSDVELMFPKNSKEFKYIRKVILDGMNDYTRSYLRILFGDVEGLVMK